jgi:hypothetical protein
MIYVSYRGQDLPLGPSDMFFHYQILLRCSPIWGDGAHTLRGLCMRGGYGRINGGTRVFELAAESRDIAVGYGVRSASTSMLTSSRPKGG